MGWRADAAYEKSEREEWRRFIAVQPLWRRVYIRAWRWVVVAAVAVVVVGPLAVGIIRSLF